MNQLTETRVGVEFTPARLSINNYEQIKQAIDSVADFYSNQVVTKEQKKSAEASRSELISLEKQLDEERKRVKSIYNQPLQEYETKMKELTSAIRKPLDDIREGLKQIEEGERLERESILLDFIKDYTQGTRVTLEDFKELPTKWLNKGNFSRNKVGSKLAEEVEFAIETLHKEREEFETNMDTIATMCELNSIEKEPWLLLMDSTPFGEIINLLNGHINKLKTPPVQELTKDEHLIEAETKTQQMEKIDVKTDVINQPRLNESYTLTGTREQIDHLLGYANQIGVSAVINVSTDWIDELPF